jgi:hypothetical protein
VATACDRVPGHRYRQARATPACDAFPARVGRRRRRGRERPHSRSGCRADTPRRDTGPGRIWSWSRRRRRDERGRRIGLLADGHCARRRNRLRNGRGRSGFRCRRCGRRRSRRRLVRLGRLSGCVGRSRRRLSGRRMGMRCRGRSRRRRRRLCGIGSSAAVWRRGRVRRGSSGQERDRVDVPLLVRCPPHAQVEVRLRPVGLSARPGRRDHVSFDDGVSPADKERSEVLHHDRVAVRGPDGQGLAPLRHRAGERHDARCGRAHVGAVVGGDVEPPMLPAGVRIVAEHERPQHIPVSRPRPCLGRSGKHTASEHEQNQETAHTGTPCSRKRQHPPGKVP